MDRRAKKLKELRDRITGARPRQYDTGPGADFDVRTLDSGGYLDFATPPTDSIPEVDPSEVQEIHETRPRSRDPLYMDAVPVDPREVEVMDADMYAESPDEPVVVGEGDVEAMYDEDPRDTDACTFRRSSAGRQRRPESFAQRVRRAMDDPTLDLSDLGAVPEIPDTAIPEAPAASESACPPGCAPLTMEEDAPALADEGIVDVGEEEVTFLDEEGDERAKSSDTLPELGEEVTASTEGTAPSEEVVEAAAEEEIETAIEQPKEAEVKTNEVVEILANADRLADVKSDQVELILTREQTDNPHYIVLVEGDPVAKVALTDQSTDFLADHSDMFTDPSYSGVVLENVDKFGLPSVLNTIHARFYAAHAEQGVVAQQMKTAATEDLRHDHHRRLAEMKDNLINTANLVIAASVKNYILDNPLRDELVREVRTAGVAPKAAVDLVERALHNSAADYFRNVLAKAEEWLGAPPEVLQHHVKEITGMNYRHPGYEDLDQENEFTEERVAEVLATPKSVPIRSMASAATAPAASITDREYWKQNMNLHGMLVQKSLANTPYKR